MSVIPNFADVPLRAGGDKPRRSLDDWRGAVGREVDPLTWQTPEGIPVKPLYTAADLRGIDHLDTLPGMVPFLRGPYPTMYVLAPRA